MRMFPISPIVFMNCEKTRFPRREFHPDRKFERRCHAYLSPDAILAFRQEIYHYYHTHARRFPWRETRNPYHILVSEIMLQQTQTTRVMEKYAEFIDTFPNFECLARASVRDILKVWRGLGYNRRALSLKKLAERIVREYKGDLPSRVSELVTLPGIGKATAAAIAAFAFDQPSDLLETNIRRVFIHFFFQDKIGVRDSEILPLIRCTCDTSNPKEWYYALMDYGAMLKQRYPNPNQRSAHYRRQSRFEDSDRQIRGMILRTLIMEPHMQEYQIIRKLGKKSQRVRKNIIQLEMEGFIRRKGKCLTIA